MPVAAASRGSCSPFSFDNMKGAFCSGILSAAVIAACACAHCQNVYSLGIYSAGNTWTDLCSLSVPFPPYQYKLTERRWYEDANGLTIMELGRRNEQAGVLRRLLEVQCGSNSFSIPLDHGGRKRGQADDIPPGVGGSGDLARLLTNCVTNRGGHTRVSRPATVPSTWVLYSREAEDVIVVAGDHFSEVQTILEQTCGTGDTTIKSSACVGNGRSITYAPKQLGVMLNLTADSSETIVSVVGKRKP